MLVFLTVQLSACNKQQYWKRVLFEYADIRKAFYTPQHQDCYSVSHSCVLRHSYIVITDHCCVKGRYCTAIPNRYYTAISSNNTFTSLLFSDPRSHCCQTIGVDSCGQRDGRTEIDSPCCCSLTLGSEVHVTATAVGWRPIPNFMHTHYWFKRRTASKVWKHFLRPRKLRSSNSP